MVYMGTLTLLPLVLQSNLGYTATWAGLAAAPIGFLPIFLSPLIGRFGNKIDMRLLVTGSFLMFAFTFHWRTDFYAGMDMSNVVWPQFWQGLGVAMFFLPLTTITLSHMKGPQIASASSLSNFLRVFMGGVGVSVVSTMWERREALHHTQLTEHITPYSPDTTEAIHQMAEAGLNGGQAVGLINSTITQQGFIVGSNEIFCGQYLVHYHDSHYLAGEAAFPSRWRRRRALMSVATEGAGISNSRRKGRLKTVTTVSDDFSYAEALEIRYNFASFVSRLKRFAKTTFGRFIPTGGRFLSKCLN